MSDHNKKELQKAIEYLRYRGIYIADKDCKFVPTSIAHTNVSQTMARYRRQTEGKKMIREVK